MNFEHLGIPKHKHNLLNFDSVYKLSRNYDNFVIIFTYDRTIRGLRRDYTNKVISLNSLNIRTRKHIKEFYGIGYGFEFKHYINRYFKSL